MSEAGGGGFPPVIGIITADPSGWLAALGVISASTEETMAQVTGAVDAGAESLTTASASADDAAASMDTVAGSADTAAGSLDAVGASGDEAAAGLDAAAASADGAAASMDTASASTDGAAASADSAGTNFTGLSSLMGIAAGAVVLSSIDMASNWQQSVNQIANSSNIPVEAAINIANQLKVTANGSTFSANQVTAAFAGVSGQLTLLYGKSVSAAQAQQVMKAAMDLSEASGEGLANSTSDLVSLMGAFGLSTGQASGAANVLYNASKLSGTSIDDLTTGIDRLHARLGVAAPGINDISTAVAVMAQHGITGNRALMQLNTGLTNLLDPSKSTADAIRFFGLQVFNSNGQFVGMADLIKQLNPLLDKMSQQQREVAEAQLFGKGAAGTLNTVMSGGLATWDSANKLVTQHGAVEDAAARNAASFEGSLKKLWVQVQNIGEAIGAKLIPVVIKVIEWFQKHQAAAYALAGVLGGVLLAGIVAATAAIVGFIGTAGLIVGAIGAVVGVLIYGYEHWKTFRTVVNDVVSWIKGTALPWLEQTWNTIRNDLDRLYNWWHNHWQNIEDDTQTFIKTISGFFQGFWDQIVGMFDFFRDLITGKWSKLGGDLENIGSGFLEQIKGLFTAFATGIQEFWDSFGGDIEHWAHAAWGKMVQAAKDEIGYVIDAVTALPGDILAAVGDLGSLLYNAGVSVIEGFIKGVTSVIGDVKNTFSNLTNDLTSWKGPPERDAVLLFDNGRRVMQGFNSGLLAEWDNTQHLLRGFTAQVPNVTAAGLVSQPGVRGLTAASAAAAAGATAPTGPVTFVLEVDGKTFGRVVMDGLAVAATSGQRIRAQQIGLVP